MAHSDRAAKHCWQPCFAGEVGRGHGEGLQCCAAGTDSISAGSSRGLGAGMAAGIDVFPRGHTQCGHLLKQKAKSAASERWMAIRLSQNNKDICLFSKCCIAAGKIKMHVFSQVFITDLIFNRGADCGGVIVWFVLLIFFS